MHFLRKSMFWHTIICYVEAGDEKEERQSLDDSNL